MEFSAHQQKILKSLQALDKKKVKVAVADIDGVLRGKYLHIDKFLSAAEKGFGFCSVVFGWDSSDSLYDNTRYTGWHCGYPDATAEIDFATYRNIPWDNGIGFFLADFVDKEQKPLAVCPRQLLKRVIRRLKDKNLAAIVGCEFEWFNFAESSKELEERGFLNPKPITPGMFGYSLLRSSENSAYFNDLMDLCEAFRIPIEGLHTETGPGVYEAALRCSDVLEAGDRAILFKTAAKEIAQKHGFIASFMARWNTKLPGCSGHIHQSLQDASGQNIFYDAKSPNKMSSIFQSYLAGQIKYLPELLLMLAPNVNSYKRLVKGFWAPTRSTWGFDNRTVALRVIGDSPSSMRVETRLPGADVNPYLALAASIGAGLIGVEKNLRLTDSDVKGNGYDSKNGVALPANLLEACQTFENSQVARELFPEDFIYHYTATRRWEWQQFERAVTDW